VESYKQIPHRHSPPGDDIAAIEYVVFCEDDDTSQRSVDRHGLPSRHHHNDLRVPASSRANTFS